MQEAAFAYKDMTADPKVRGAVTLAEYYENRGLGRGERTGIGKGIGKGIGIGKKEGRAEGRQEGRQEEKAATIQAMISKGYSHADIARISEAEVASIAERQAN